MVTFWTLKDLTYQALAMEWDVWSGQYDETTIVWPRINEIVDDICKGHVVSLTEKTSSGDAKVYSAGDLPFLRKSSFIETVGTQALWSAVATTDTEITFTTSSFDSSWAVEIEGDVINYTGKSSTQITGVTNIGMSHVSGAIVYPLYPLPSDISKPFVLQQIYTDGSFDEIDPIDPRCAQHMLKRYCIVVDDAGTEYIRLLWFDTDGQKIRMIYYANSTDMSDDSDTCTIPEKYARKIVPNLVAGELMREREEEQYAASKLNIWYKHLQQMYNYYTTQNKQKNPRVQIVWFNRNITNGWQRFRIY